MLSAVSAGKIDCKIGDYHFNYDINAWQTAVKYFAYVIKVNIVGVYTLVYLTAKET